MALSVPLLPHSFWLGHLAILAKCQLKYPRDLLVMTLPQLVAEDYPELAAQHGLFYLDSWPFSYPMIAVMHPDLIAQFTQQVSFPKHPTLQTEFMPFTQCRDLLNLEGAEWKLWRGVFNPGFSVKNLMALMPAFVEEIGVFRDWLGCVADDGRVVPLDDQASALAADVIGRAALDARLNCQVQENAFYNAVKAQVKHLIIDNSPPSMLKRLNPRRPFQIRRNNRIMDAYLTPLIEQEAGKHSQSIASPGDEQQLQSQPPPPSPPPPKTIISLAVKAYMDEMQSQSQSQTLQTDSKPHQQVAPKLDPTFVATAIAQIKIFVLAGHDTTSAALSFSYHLLHKHPATLRLLRAEHDRVLGPDPATAPALLSTSPQLLNQLPYTSAIIKESLRLFPPAASVRIGSQQGHCLVHPVTGQRYPTEGFLLFSCHSAAHRYPTVWPRADDFVPERWLAREGEPLHVRKNAFRAFELGPRNCIGQELAQMELRAILALTAREFAIESVYEGGKDQGQWKGDACYPCSTPGDFATGHPKDSLPVRVRRRVHVPAGDDEVDA
ncbi:cytochrome P450 [Coniella lustricola]|uniref:Cytochrome P450 n=1 Tax=Coniella lustricola TaxID=2025994 RepID=A0A2T3A103_9PEZI|nr:cytochrome P450 [Coniella lustricola]